MGKEIHKRRIFLKIVLVLSILLMGATVSSDVPNPLFHMDSVMVIPTNQSYLTIRRGPGFTYPVIYSVDSINALTVVEKGLWYKVLHNDVYGYVYGTAFIDSEAYEPNRLKGFTIGIDADGQMALDKKSEFIAPQSKLLKERMNERHIGTYTGIYDYDVNFKVALKLKKALEDEGATVIMSRESADISKSNRERADYLNKFSCDLVVSISCESSKNPIESGIQVYIPKLTNSEETKKFAEIVLNKLSEGLGIDKPNVKVSNDITFLNWSKGNAIKIELGYLSNRTEEKRLGNDNYQQMYARYIKDSIVESLLQSNQE